MAARDRFVAVKREDLLDSVDVVGVDNGRDIIVSGAQETVEADLAEHTWDVLLPVGDGVPVTDPACWESLVGGLGALDDELWKALETGAGSEDDGTLGGVLVDEVH